MALIRLNKFIASSGLCSRRDADKLISEGKVFVNNYLTRELGTKIDDDKDAVRVGKNVIKTRAHAAIALNKPKEFVCTRKSTHGEKTIMELLPKSLQYLNPVGRLDKDSEGLIIMTNDGDLALRLTHPKKHVEKEYIVTVKGEITEGTLVKLEKGVKLIGFTARPVKVKLIFTSEERSMLHITLKEGKKRQIRDMMFSLGHRVKKLERIRIGHYIMNKKLPRGAFQFLQPSDIAKLQL